MCCGSICGPHLLALVELFDGFRDPAAFFGVQLILGSEEHLMIMVTDKGNPVSSCYLLCLARYVVTGDAYSTSAAADVLSERELTLSVVLFEV